MQPIHAHHPRLRIHDPALLPNSSRPHLRTPHPMVRTHGNINRQTVHVICGGDAGGWQVRHHVWKLLDEREDLCDCSGEGSGVVHAGVVEVGERGHIYVEAGHDGEAASSGFATASGGDKGYDG